MPQENPFAKYGGEEIAETDPFEKYGGTLEGKEEPTAKKVSVYDLPAGATPPPEVLERQARSRRPDIQYAEPERGTLEQLATGAGKAVGETVFGAGKMLGIEPPPISTERRGAAEQIGGFAAETGEFIAGTSALKKMLSLAKVPEAVLALANKYPKAAKLFGEFLEAHPILQKAAETGAETGAVGAALGALKAEEGEKVREAIAGGVGGALGGAATEAVGAAVKPLAKYYGLGGLTGKEAMTKAASPTLREGAWEKSLDLVMPRVLEKTKTAKINTVGDFINVLEETADDIWNAEIQPVIQKYGHEPIDTKKIATTVRRMITPAKRRFKPQEAMALENFASEFEKVPATIEDAVHYLKEIFNPELRNFYKLPARERAAILRTNPEIAAYESAARGLRDAVEQRLRDLGETTTMKSRSEWGALQDLIRVFDRALKLENKRKPLSAAQVHSLALAGGHALSAFLLGHPIAAIGAVGYPLAATAVKSKQTPAGLIRQGLKAYGKELGGRTSTGVGKEVAGEIAKGAGAATLAGAAKLIRIRTSDGYIYDVHPDDVDTVMERDPEAQIIVR